MPAAHRIQVFLRIPRAFVSIELFLRTFSFDFFTNDGIFLLFSQNYRLRISVKKCNNTFLLVRVTNHF